MFVEYTNIVPFGVIERIINKCGIVTNSLFLVLRTDVRLEQHYDVSQDQNNGLLHHKQNGAASSTQDNKRFYRENAVLL